MSAECKKYIKERLKQKSVIKYYFLLGFWGALFFSIPIILLGIFLSPQLYAFEILPIVAMIVFPLEMRAKENKPPHRIVTDDLFVEVFAGNENPAYRMERIEKVVDMGTFYHIILIHPIPNQNFVCQKDLLVKGTLEDFENLFAGKIIRQ